MTGGTDVTSEGHLPPCPFVRAEPGLREQMCPFTSLAAGFPAEHQLWFGGDGST